MAQASENLATAPGELIAIGVGVLLAAWVLQMLLARRRFLLPIHSFVPRAITTLSDPGWTKGRPAGPLLLAKLQAHYSWTALRAPGLTAWRLVPRPR